MVGHYEVDKKSSLAGCSDQWFLQTARSADLLRRVTAPQNGYQKLALPTRFATNRTQAAQRVTRPKIIRLTLVTTNVEHYNPVMRVAQLSSGRPLARPTIDMFNWLSLALNK